MIRENGNLVGYFLAGLAQRVRNASTYPLQLNSQGYPARRA